MLTAQSLSLLIEKLRAVRLAVNSLATNGSTEADYYRMCALVGLEQTIGTLKQERRRQEDWSAERSRILVNTGLSPSARLSQAPEEPAAAARGRLSAEGVTDVE
jgi:hypothetical protein